MTSGSNSGGEGDPAGQHVLRSLDTDVLAGRLHDIVGDLWAPHVLLIAPHLAGAELNELLDTMRQHKTRMTVALVLADDPDRADATR